jgi:nitrite reductase/ring-hydroxylating ferredoxin subunit
MKIPSYIYICEKHFARELKNIFYNGWSLVGLTADLNSDKTFFCNSVYGCNLFAQRNSDEIHVFQNICPHRMHPLRNIQKGKGPIVCPYHGWSFNYNGKIKKIPYNEECYFFSNPNFHLNEFPSKKVGTLLFANLSQKRRRLPFSNSFGDEIERITSNFSDVIKKTYRKKFNWKLAIENLKDGLHPLFIHESTLNKAVDVGLPGIPKNIPGFVLNETNLSYGGADVKVSSYLLEKYIKNFEFSPDENRYLNYHIFPNIHLASPDGGRSFVLEHYKPLSPSTTEIDVYYIFTKNNLDKITKDKLMSIFIRDAEFVYEEDFTLLENIQSNLMRMPESSLNLGAFERMIERFYKVYFWKIPTTGYLMRLMIDEIKAVKDFITSKFQL